MKLVWSDWSSVSEGLSTPGGSVTAVQLLDPVPSQVALFLADPNGGVYTTSGNAQTGWAPWTTVSEGRTVPGAPVTAVRIGTATPGPNRTKFALFLTGRGLHDVGQRPGRLGALVQRVRHSRCAQVAYYRIAERPALR